MKCIWCKQESENTGNFKQREFVNTNGKEELVSLCLTCDEVYIERFRESLRYNYGLGV